MVCFVKDNNCAFQIRKSLASELVMCVCNSVFTVHGTASSPHPSHLPFLHAVLDFAVALDLQVSAIFAYYIKIYF